MKTVDEYKSDIQDGTDKLSINHSCLEEKDLCQQLKSIPIAFDHLHRNHATNANVIQVIACNTK